MLLRTLQRVVVLSCFSASAALLSSLLLPSAAHAQYTWIGGGGNDWNVPTNWLGGLPPKSTATSLTFDATALTFTPNANETWTLGSMAFSTGFTVSGLDLTLGGSASIDVLGTALVTISNSLTLSAPAIVNVESAAQITLSGAIVGAQNVVKVGAGSLVVSGPNYPSGNITFVQGGTLTFGDGATGPASVGSLQVNGSLVFDNGTSTLLSVNGAVTGTGTITITQGTAISQNNPAPFTHAGQTTVDGIFNGSASNPSITNNAPLVIGNAGQFFSATGSVGSLAGSGQFQNTGLFTVGGDNTSTTYSGLLGGSGLFTKVGTGTLTIGTNNTWFGGAVTVEAPGTLRVGNGANGPSNVGNFVTNGNLVFDNGIGTPLNVNGTVTGTGTVTITQGTALSQNNPAPFTHLGQTTVDGTFNGSASNPSITNNAPLVIGNAGQFFSATGSVGSLAGSGQFQNTGLFTVGSDNTTTTYSGLLGGSGLFTKVGTGTLTIGTNNTWFAGEVTVEAPGTLRVGDGANGPSNVGNFVANGNLVFNNGVGALLNVNGTVTGAGTVTITQGTAISQNNPAPFTHLGQTTVDGIFGSALNPSVVNNAPLVIGNLGQFFTTTGSVGSLAGSGQFQNTGLFTVGSDNTSTTYSGLFSGVGSFTKVGTGTLTLSGNGAGHSGPVQVNGGTLVVTGSLGGSVTVANGATLMGTGTVGPVTTAAGSTIAPGLSPGVLNTASVNLSGNVAMEILGATVGTQYDQMNVTGTVTLTAATLVLSGGYVPAAGNTFVLINNDGADAVTGTFAGLPQGAIFVFNGVMLQISYTGGTGNDVVLSPAAYAVTPSAGANGTINPNAPVSVLHGATTSFTVTPNAGYAAVMGGTCAVGSLAGTTYTTGVITGACTVTASFTLNNYAVSASAGANGTITPPTQTVAHGTTTTFTVTPNAGYAAVMGGTCAAGSLVGTTYTTGVITAACTVTASFTLNNYTVTPSAGANGSITPGTPQTIGHGATTTFTVTPNAGYNAAVGGTCGGVLAGTTYTTNAITANCSVAATFTSGAVTSFTGPTATGTGNATASFTGGGATCTYATAQLIPVTGHAASPPAGNAPANRSFPHGLFDFRLTGCTPGSAITMSITYPAAPAISSGQYWKYGPEPGNTTPHWYVMPSTLGANTVVFTITDGQQGDDDLTANGTIVDQGGPGVPGAPGTATAVPTSSEWMLMLLATLMLGVAFQRQRARR